MRFLLIHQAQLSGHAGDCTGRPKETLLHRHPEGELEASSTLTKERVSTSVRRGKEGGGGLFPRKEDMSDMFVKWAFVLAFDPV